MANRIKDVLKEKGITQKALANKMATSLSYINELCTNKGNPTLQKIEEVARALDVPAYTLIGDYDPKQLQEQIAKQMLAGFIPIEEEE